MLTGVQVNVDDLEDHETAQVSVDAAGNIQNEDDVQETTNDAEDEGLIPCKVWMYTQSNCMFNLGSTAGDMKQYTGKMARMKSFRMTRSSGKFGDDCAVESYSKTNWEGDMTKYTKGECIKTSNAYGQSKSYKLLGNPKPAPCSNWVSKQGYWKSQFQKAGVSQDQMEEICYNNAQWYYKGRATKVGMGGYNVNCNNKLYKCAGGSKFGYGSSQAGQVKRAISNGGVYPGYALLEESADVEIEDVHAEEIDGADEDIDGWKMYEVVEAEAAQQKESWVKHHR